VRKRDRSVGSALLEEIFEIRHRVVVAFARRARATRGSEIITAIRAVSIHDSLGTRFAAFVVRTRIVVSTIQAHVQVGATAIASVTKSDRLTGRQRNLSLACMAIHPIKPAAKSVRSPMKCTIDA
jgi:hypothetical protein